MTSSDPVEAEGNDMPEAMKIDVKLNFMQAIVTCKNEEEISKYLKAAFEKKYHGKWHCVVGTQFGSAVTFDEHTHYSAQIGQYMIELWKCGPLTS